MTAKSDEKSDGRTVVYTDGACLGNPGPGGWAWAVPDGAWASGAEAHTTNQRMEITAVAKAALDIEGPLDVVSDSTYVVNCWRDRWWEGWLQRGWTNKAKKPVANRELWEPLIDIWQHDPQRMRLRWVKGHSDDVMNDLVDRLAVEAARTQQAALGEGAPAELPAPDVGREANSPAGHKIVVVGHRPPGLGGYEENFITSGVRDKLTEILTAKRQLHDDLVVLTGLGLGAEQLAAEAANEAGVPYVAVLAFPDQDSVWPAATKRHYQELLDKAEEQVLLQHKPPENKQKAGGALSRRDAWLARVANEAIAVWDGDDAAIGRLVRSLQDHLGEEDVWILAP